MATFLDNLELVAAREFKKLETVCQCDAEDVAGMIEEIEPWRRSRPWPSTMIFPIRYTRRSHAPRTNQRLDTGVE